MKTYSLSPTIRKVLKMLGENIKLARLRRKLSIKQVSERANISPVTLWLVEKGTPTVAMGTYCLVLFILGLEQDLLLVASDDVLGRKLQDAELIVKKRAPKYKRLNEILSLGQVKEKEALIKHKKMNIVNGRTKDLLIDKK